MNIEFHYYITYILAYESGFSEPDSFKIAYSSQYTDDNNKIALIKDSNSEEYKGYISQTMNIFRPINKLVRIYSCFHFFPGEYSAEKAKRKDGSLHILNTIPCSENAQQMFDEALNSKNLYRIGIATHVFADTWAHQNFIGYKHSFGVIEGNLVPNIGHAEAYTKPDIPNLVWTDKRLAGSNERVNNKERSLEAAEVIFRKFCEYNNTDFEARWQTLRAKLDNAIGAAKENEKQCKKESEQRIKAYKEICPSIPEYNEKVWLEEACYMSWFEILKQKSGGSLRWVWNKISPAVYFIKWCLVLILDFVFKLIKMVWTGILWVIRKVTNPKLKAKAKDGFEDCDWLKFQKAVKAHQEYVLKNLAPIYKQMGIDEEIF